MTNPPFSKQPEHLYKNSDLPTDASNHPTGKPDTIQSKKKASVLLLLHLIETEWQLLFIRRSENEKDRHSGQVAFPGGAEESHDDNQVDTALRETEEEIGVAREHIKIIGTLPVYTTSSYYQVTPVVGLIDWPLTLTPAPDEVARVFSIPLAWLKNQDNFNLRPRSDGDSGRHPVVYFDHYDGELLWGASARMTLNFIRALDEGNIRLPE